MKSDHSAAEPSALAYTLKRIRRHVQWARTEGLSRLIEEDRLDPRTRIPVAWRKLRWRQSHGRSPGKARPVYVVGLQRSGTNMLMRGFDEAPEVEVRNENDRTLFRRFQLRGDDVLVATLARSRAALVLVKPLCESHRVAELLDLPGTQPGRAVWCYRDVDDRARSEVSKFGAANLRALQTIARGEGASIWQGQALTPELIDLVAGFDTDTMTPDTAAALFWYVRNRLYFDLGLDRRADILLTSYDELVRDPEGAMRALCAHLDFPYRPQLHAHIAPRDSHGSRRLDIDPAVRARCDELADRLDNARRSPRVPPTPPPPRTPLAAPTAPGSTTPTSPAEEH